jgi:hypothetical protein
MTRDEWLELATRCEKATGPDREIDAAIALAFGWKEVKQAGISARWFAPQCYSFDYAPPQFTASLDAITSLIEREMGDDLADIISQKKRSEAFVDIWSERRKRKLSSGHAATEAIARCAAFCRAMGEKANER